MSILQRRLKSLEGRMGRKRAYLTVFRLADGSRFATGLDPVSYVLQHGAHTPRGDITGCDDPIKAQDSISAALNEFVLSAIREGRGPSAEELDL